MTIKEMQKAIIENPKRSAWERGVQKYALELLENMTWYADKEQREPVNSAEARKWMLNGADNWKHFSWGGCSLCYDGDIAKRLCNPSEYRLLKGGTKKPNKDEEWLDTQTRALTQACNLVLSLIIA